MGQMLQAILQQSCLRTTKKLQSNQQALWRPRWISFDACRQHDKQQQQQWSALSMSCAL